ncbi:MAG: TatD family hydrolase [Odoribacter sp.]
MYIDTHSHLYEDEFRDDREEVVQRAKAAGVGALILPDIDGKSRAKMLELEALHPEMMFPAVGLHPTSVNENYRQELAEVEKQLTDRPFYAIGECGIDLYWDTTFHREQVKAFEHQLGLAKDLQLPVIIHSRESLKEIFLILKKHPYLRGVFHCFPGDEEDAHIACEMGFLLGIGGVVTFKKSQMAATIQKIGIDHLLLETDAPYLTPVPYRGKRNESAYIPLIANAIAELTGIDVKKIEEITSQNAMNLFNLHRLNDNAQGKCLI